MFWVLFSVEFSAMVDRLGVEERANLAREQALIASWIHSFKSQPKNRNQKWKNFPNKHISILKDLGHAAVLKHAIFRDVQHRSDRHGSPLWNARNRSSRAPFGRPWRIAIWSSWTAAAARPVAAVVFRNVERGRFPQSSWGYPQSSPELF